MSDDDDVDDNDPIAFVREAVRQVCWNLAYHEVALPGAYRKLEVARELLTRLNLTVNQIDRVEIDDYDEQTDLETFGAVEQMVASIFHECSHSIGYHEKALKQAQSGVAMAKIMLARGKYSEIDFREIEREQRERAEK